MSDTLPASHSAVPAVSPPSGTAGRVVLTPAGERLLSAASDLFYQHGIHAVGVDRIAEMAGTTKKTLYDRFGSKDALVALYLQHRFERWQRFVQEYVEAHAGPAGSDGPGAPGAAETARNEKATRRVLATLDALEAWYAELSRGCAFVNAYAEIGGTDHPGVSVVRAEKLWTRHFYMGLLREAGFDDEELIEDLGTRLTLLHEGASTMSTAGALPDVFDHARSAARQLLSTLA